MDFAHDYMRALLAKEIDVAAELQKQRSQVVYQQYCAGGTTVSYTHLDVYKRQVPSADLSM